MSTAAVCRDLVNELSALFSVQAPSPVLRRARERYAENDDDSYDDGDDALVASKDDEDLQPAPSEQSFGPTYWTKGTGYGYDGIADWDIENHVRETQKRVEKVSALFLRLAAVVKDAKERGEMNELIPTLKSSPLMAILSDTLAVSSLTELQLHEPKYRAVLSLLKSLSESDLAVELIFNGEGDKASSSASADEEKKLAPNTPRSQASIFERLDALAAKAHAAEKLFSRLPACGADSPSGKKDDRLVIKPMSQPELKLWMKNLFRAAREIAGEQAQSAPRAVSSDASSESDGTLSSEIIRLHTALTPRRRRASAASGLQSLSPALPSSFELAAPPIPSASALPASAAPASAALAPAAPASAAPVPDAKEMELVAKAYCAAMAPLQFAHIPEFGYHRFQAEGSAQAGPSEFGRSFVKRVVSEWADMAESLPLSFGSSVFWRMHESRMSMSQFLVTGPEDTPYSGGCFLFDLQLPKEYPSKSPKCQLQTTGNDRFRFNPNLYENGYVCLSLLGTWGGSSAESWNPATSTLLQLAVSIQSLIFVPHPYFNEPGYESEFGSDSAMSASDLYNVPVESATIRFAMIDMLRSPPVGFEEVVKTHFRLRGPAILAQCRAWNAKPGRNLSAEIAELEAELKKL